MAIKFHVVAMGTGVSVATFDDEEVASDAVLAVNARAARTVVALAAVPHNPRFAGDADALDALMRNATAHDPAAPVTGPGPVTGGAVRNVVSRGAW